MQVQKKDNYTLISSEENSFIDFYKAFLEIEKNLEKEHLVLHISEDINIQKENFLLFLINTEHKKEIGTSFVIVNTKVNVDDFPESLNIVPTLTEAEDIIEMEAIERELGF